MGARSYSREGGILKLLTLTAVIVLCQGQNVTVVLDVYTPTSALDNNTTLQLGTTCILLCRTGGLPHGTDYNYTWTCPNGPCTIGQGRNTNRDTYGNRLLLNILSYSDAGTYICQVRLATTGQLLGMDQFVLGVEGGIVLHSGNNLIPNNDFITSLQDITSNTTIIIQCTSHQQPHWRGPNGQTLSTIQNNTLHQILNGNTSILTIDTNNLSNFTNGRFSCNTTQHTANVNLYIGPGGSLPTPGVTSRFKATHIYLSLALETLAKANRFIFSYQRQDLNVPLEVEYQEVVVPDVNSFIIKEISIPGVMYMVKIWAVNGSQYSLAPVLVEAIPLQLAQVPSKPRFLTVTTTFTQGLQLNWIPPKQPNGPILYQLNYGTNTTQFTTVDTAGDDTYYNLTGLQQNTAYYIRVVAVSNMTVNGVARIEGEWITAATEREGLNGPDTTFIGVAVGVSAGLLLVIIIILIAVVGCVLQTRQRKTKTHTQSVNYVKGALRLGGEGRPEKEAHLEGTVVANTSESGAMYCKPDIVDKKNTSGVEEDVCNTGKYEIASPLYQSITSTTSPDNNGMGSTHKPNDHEHKSVDAFIEEDNRKDLASGTEQEQLSDYNSKNLYTQPIPKSLRRATHVTDGVPATEVRTAKEGPLPHKAPEYDPPPPGGEGHYQVVDMKSDRHQADKEHTQKGRENDAVTEVLYTRPMKYKSQKITTGSAQFKDPMFTTLPIKEEDLYTLPDKGQKHTNKAKGGSHEYTNLSASTMDPENLYSLPDMKTKVVKCKELESGTPHNTEKDYI